MRIEKQSRDRYNKYPNAVEAKLIKIANRFQKNPKGDDATLEGVVLEVIKRLKEEYRTEFENIFLNKVEPDIIGEIESIGDVVINVNLRANVTLKIKGNAYILKDPTSITTETFSVVRERSEDGLGDIVIVTNPIDSILQYKVYYEKF